MAVHSGANLHMSQVNAEFGWGNNMNAYRGRQWWTDAGATGHFSAGQIHMSEFRGKRPTAPAGISYLSHVANYSSLFNNSVLNLGENAADRYLVITLSQEISAVSSAANNNQRYDRFWLDGVELPLLARNSYFNVNKSNRVAIFGGYHSGPTSANATARNANNADTTLGAVSVWQLRGNGLALRNSHTANQTGGVFSTAVPNASFILAVSNNLQTGYTGLTLALDDGSQGHSRVAYAHYPTGGSVSVELNGRSRAYVLIG